MPTTKPTNTNDCDHDFAPSLTESGVEVCQWCSAVRESPAVPREGVDVPVGFVAAERRAA